MKEKSGETNFTYLVVNDSIFMFPWGFLAGFPWGFLIFLFSNRVSICRPIIKSQHHMLTVHHKDLVVDKVNCFQITGCQNTSDLATSDVQKASLNYGPFITECHILKPKP